MGTGIIICGLNGVGKSTLGKALAEKLHFHFIDNEDLYFPKTDTNYTVRVCAGRWIVKSSRIFVANGKLSGEFTIVACK